jgi:hypothetical protein
MTSFVRLVSPAVVGLMAAVILFLQLICVHLLGGTLLVLFWTAGCTFPLLLQGGTPTAAATAAAAASPPLFFLDDHLWTTGIKFIPV